MQRVSTGVIYFLMALAALVAAYFYLIGPDGIRHSLDLGTGTSSSTKSGGESSLTTTENSAEIPEYLLSNPKPSSTAAGASASTAAVSSTTRSGSTSSLSTPTQSARVSDPTGDTSTTTNGDATLPAVWLDQQADLVSATYDLRANDPVPTLTITWTINGTVVATESQPPNTFQELFGTKVGDSGWEVLVSSNRSVVVRHFTDLSGPDCASATATAPVGGTTVTATIPLSCFELAQASTGTMQPFTRIVNGPKVTEDFGTATSVAFPLH